MTLRIGLPSVVLFALLSGSKPIAGQEEPALVLQSAELQDDGRSVKADYGHLTVPVRHDDPDAGSIRLAVAVRRSTSATPGPPTFFLNGIPSSALNDAARAFWDDYLALGDVVFFDQRGAGRSQPSLSWERPPYRAELFLSNRTAARDNLFATAEAIRSFADGAGVDLAAFQTRESAADVDTLRRALGYERIRLVAHSGGTHLGFEVVRRYGESIEHFAALGTAGPNDIHSLPSQIDASLRRVSDLAAADARIGEAVPDLFGRVSAMLDRVEAEPLVFEVVHPDSGERVELQLGRYGLQFLLLLELGDPEDLAVLPRLVHEVEEGRQDVLRWFVERRYEQFTSFPALLFLNRAASGATADRWKQIRKEAESSPFGSVRCLFSPELDEAFGVVDLGDGFRAPLESAVPTLFVSATLDGKTPPVRAERMRAGFSQSGHLILENGGHNDVLMQPQVHEHIVAFFAGGELQDATIQLPELRFALLEGKDPLVSHPAFD